MVVFSSRQVQHTSFFIIMFHIIIIMFPLVDFFVLLYITLHNVLSMLIFLYNKHEMPFYVNKIH